MSGHKPERIDHDCPCLDIICCAQQTVKLGMIGDSCCGPPDDDDSIEDMLRLTMEIVDPDATCEPGVLWLSRDDALHLASVLTMFAVTLERTRLQCTVRDSAEAKALVERLKKESPAP